MPTQSLTEVRTNFNLNLCLEHLRYAQAVELARSGKYLEAESALSPRGLLPDSARELDLLARIAALQKQFSRADNLWEAALRKSPGNEEYIECLEAVRNIDPTTDFDQKEKEASVFEAILVYVAWIVALFGFATIIYVFYPGK